MALDSLLFHLAGRAAGYRFALTLKQKATIVLSSISSRIPFPPLLPLAHIFTCQHLFGELPLPNSQSTLSGMGMTDKPP